MSKRTNEELLALHWEGKDCPKSDDARQRILIRAYYANEEVRKFEEKRAKETGK
jgi:hypothetical protein